MDLPPLPDHFHVVVLLERAFLGELCPVTRRP